MTQHETPTGLHYEAAAFWQSVMRDFILEPYEVAILTEACRCLDEATSPTKFSTTRAAWSATVRAAPTGRIKCCDTPAQAAWPSRPC